MVTPEWIEGRILRHSEIVFKGCTFPARLIGKASSGFVNGSASSFCGIRNCPTSRGRERTYTAGNEEHFRQAGESQPMVRVEMIRTTALEQRTYTSVVRYEGNSPNRNSGAPRVPLPIGLPASVGALPAKEEI